MCIVSTKRKKTEYGTAKRTVIFRKISVLALALAAIVGGAAAVAFAADAAAGASSAAAPNVSAPIPTSADTAVRPKPIVRPATPLKPVTPDMKIPGTGAPIPYIVPPYLSVPEVPAESGRVIVADTLRFRWPPLDSAEAAKRGVPFDSSAARIFHADTSSTEAGDGAAGAFDASDAADKEAKTAEPAAPKRPKTRQELGKMSREELFRLAFGRDAPDKPRNLTVRVFGEGRPVGSTEIAYNNDFSVFTFKSTALSRLLDRVILPSAREAVGDSAGYFSSDLMEAAGYKLRVDDMRFELHITFPPDDKGVQFTDLSGGYQVDEPRGEEIPAATVSLYVNYSVDDRARYLWYGRDPAYSGRRGNDTITRDPATVNLEGALNVNGWVFESSGWIREPYGREPFTWEHIRRDDARLVRDFVKPRSQLTLLDIMAGTSILPGPMSGGVRYEHNNYFFGNDPYSNLNSVTFFMAEAGEVEVYMNGTFRRRLYLPAGHHQVGGFGGEPGRNSVRLLLRSPSGSAEEVPFEFVLSDPRIMARGDLRYALSAGVRREYAPSPACFNYYGDEPVVSADVAYGLHHAINTGLSAVATRHTGLGGAQISFDAGGLGFVDMRAMLSYRADDMVAGGRAEASYTADLKRPVARFNLFATGDPERVILPQLSLALRGYYQTGYYTTRMFDEPYLGVNGNLGGFSGNFAAALWRGSVSATAGVNYYRMTGFEAIYYPNDYNYGVRLSQGLGRSYFSVSAGEYVRGGVRSPYFTLNTNHAFGTDFRVRGHRFSASANAGMSTRYVQAVRNDSLPEKPDSMEVDWSYGGVLGWGWSNDATGGGTRAYTAEMRFENDQTPTVSATLRHIYNRARLNADYDLLFGNYVGYDERQNHAFRGELTGSFMFADGVWAMGQPVSGGGFVLIDPRGDLADATVHVNRSRAAGNEFSRSGALGAAYHNRLMSYSPTELTLSLTDVPVGAFLEQSRYYAMGTYKQGFALKVGKRSQVMAVVPFVDKRSGRPLGHTYLTVTADADNQDEETANAPRASFTSDDGILQMGGLAPGYRYRVRFRQSSRLKDVFIEIPEDAHGIYEHPVVEVDRED
jgi:outer membrane usher protein FimD/PapC